jgi:hypothetical protein
MDNCIGFDDSKKIKPLEDKQLFRVISIERLLELFTKKELVLVKPSAWDDPFENFILNAADETEDGRAHTLNQREDIYGQCWSETRESDAMWRIYSQNFTGVKIRTTIGKLYKTLKLNESPNRQSIFIGKVAYKNQKDLVDLAQDRIEMRNNLMHNGKVGLAKTLLFKRKEFAHETEVRIISICEKLKPQDEVFRTPIDPFDFIDQIVFDPRMNLELFEVYKSHFKKIGFKDSIIRSTLYELPNFKVSI